MTEKNYGMEWFHFTYGFRGFMDMMGKGFLIISGFGLASSGSETMGIGILILGLFSFPLSLALFYTYLKNRYIGIYPMWMYVVTLVQLWGGYVVACIFSGLIGAIILLIPTVLETIYFVHRKHVYVPKRSEAELAAIEREEEEKRERLIGRKAAHPSYGIGTIVSIQETEEYGETVKVEFKDGSKHFTYPGSLETVLQLISPSVETDIKPLEKEKEQMTVDAVLKEMKNPKQPLWTQVAWSANVRVDGKLKIGYCYGTKAQDIFDTCCNVFGWDEHERGKYGALKKLYAKDAAGEGYSPWFLTHHVWIDPSFEKFEANWWNTITTDAVYEEWREVDHGFFTDFSKRITFAKTSKGYVYIGVFEPQKELINDVDPITQKPRHIKYYRLVERDYCPFN